MQEAKDWLSEVLRQARDEGAQVIGELRPCVVVPLEARQAREHERSLGHRLVEPTLPRRHEPDRATGFETEPV